jgi:hypothetical protein
VVFTGTGQYAEPGAHTPMSIDKVSGEVQVFHGQ